LLRLADGTRLRVTETPFVESDARISPDGRWIAYHSNEGGSGRPNDVYLHSLSGSAAKVQVSSMGGIVPRWRRDGKELYYLTPDRMLMAVSVDLEGDEPRIGAPSPLFQTHVSRIALRAFTVSSDGRFLVNTLVDDAARTPIRVALNWFEELDGLATN
jgi:dipeptidyl aminopeptidase/acylaminoacyl peptidase